MSTQSRVELLQKMPIFGGVTDSALELLLNQSKTLSLEKDGFFFRENDASNHMYVLEEGKVAVIKSWDGYDYLLRHLNVGDCFGEMAMLDLAPRSASVVAIEDCTAVEISANCLEEVYKKDPNQYTLIQMNMGREVSRRLRETLDLWFSEKVKSQDIDENFYFTSIT